jgi:hypothetical protein
MGSEEVEEKGKNSTHLRSVRNSLHFMRSHLLDAKCHAEDVASCGVDYSEWCMGNSILDRIEGLLRDMDLIECDE